MGIRAWRLLAVVLLLLVAAAACRAPAPLRRVFQPPSQHERYETSLRDAGLADTGLGRAWVEASQRALTSPVQVELPFREAGYFSPSEATAVGYRFDLRRGQQLTLEYEIQGGEPLVLFLDLFEHGDEPRRVASAPEDEPRLEFEADRDGTYIVRLQPELLRGGRFVLTQRLAAALAFPVPDAVGRIHSMFGDPRDAGRRDHEGIDIFAPRGTPAVAATDGVVSSVGTNNLGGNVVWVRDPARRLTLYYAHLDRATVVPGQRVQVGDTVGLIGNTGNARATPPHLHFGVYGHPSGALDPLPFVVSPPAALPAVPSDLSPIGQLRRASRNGTRLGDGAGTTVAARLERHTVLRVDGVAGTRLRVRLPDGSAGFVARGDTEALATPVRRLALQDTRPLLDRPGSGGAVVTAVAPGAPIPVLGQFEGFLLVRDAEGRQGWIASS